MEKQSRFGKKIILRGALGFPLGITVGYAITIVLSLIWANGYYAPCVPELISVMGNEIRAVILQALLCGLLGTGFGDCETDGNIFCGCFHGYDAGCLCRILDGAQPRRICRIFWDFCFYLCRGMGGSVFCRETGRENVK